MHRALGVLLALLLTAGVASAQEAADGADIDRVAAEQQLNQRIESFVAMGMPREAALFVTMLEKSGMEPAEILMFLMMADKGGGEGGGMMALMNAMKQQDAPPEPTVISTENGETFALIIEDGVLYRIDLETMEVTGKCAYSAQTRAERDAVWSVLVPLMSEWGGERGARGGPGGPPAAQCRAHLKQLGMAFMMYADAHGGTLPGEDWVQAVMAYLDNEDIFRCPAHPDLAVGYAMNTKMLGADLRQIPELSERILLFDRLDDADPAVGGPENVPLDGAHEDGVNVLFGDGHVEWLESAEAREVLGLPIGD